MESELPDGNERLKGKVAIVSGGGTVGGQGVGNGAATAILFANEGAKVTVVDREVSWGESTRERIERAGGEAIVVEADVSDPDDCERAVDETIDEFGRLDVLHNNVGIGGRASVVDAETETWEQNMSVNLRGMVHMCRPSIPEMRETGGGSIVNISSVSALKPKMGRSSAVYTTSKSAVMGLTRAMAIDHAADNIRVNCVLPGLMWTLRVAMHYSQEGRELRNEATPLSTEGEPWDIGWAATFLASDEADFITGVNLPVDGGYLLAGPSDLDRQ